MAESAALRPPMSVEEYLELEKDAPVRHEFVGGQRYAMTGTTKRHNLIVGNLIVALRAAARNTSCHVYSESVKVRTPGDVVYYPDVMVACEFDSDEAIRMWSAIPACLSKSFRPPLNRLIAARS